MQIFEKIFKDNRLFMYDKKESSKELRNQSGSEFYGKCEEKDKVSGTSEMSLLPTYKKLTTVVGNKIGLRRRSVPNIVLEVEDESFHQTNELVQYQCHSDLPKWLQDNELLYDGHRPPMPSMYNCVESIFQIHTETVNIWTHLLGCIGFLILMIDFMVNSDLGLEDKIVIGTFFFGTIVCHGFSTLLHAFSCHSEYLLSILAKMDYCGIVLLITGTYVDWCYYSLYCDTKAKLIYMFGVLVLGVLTITISFMDKFSKPEYRTSRALVFMSFGAFGLFPTVHCLVTMNWSSTANWNMISWMFFNGIVYLLGAILYATRIPERFFPGRCDIWFHSHQFSHVFTVTGSFITYYFTTNLAVYRHKTTICIQGGSYEMKTFI